ncbi:MAG: DUF4177 domain-containing protein [Bacteroidota bacterium]
MKKFEYKTLELPIKSIWSGRIDHETLVTQLNTLGSHGWEVVSQSSPGAYSGAKGPFIILKREIN